MLAPIPVHRRAHNWYGIRSAPDGPRPETPRLDSRAPVPVLRIAGLPIPIGGAPVDRRLTALL
jgi:hypothetical protein